MSGKSVLFYVQHLLGIGHLRRAINLAEAMTDAGLTVTLVSGGLPVPGLAARVARWVQLPPAAAADLSFRELVDERGQPVDDAWRTRRTALLLAALASARPDALVIELFPFGRRQMRFELLPLLQAARLRQNPPLVISSVRDVLGAGTADPQKQQRMLALFDAWFDHVLVHGDPRLIPFGVTFGPADALGARLHHTGYVVDRPAPHQLTQADDAPEVLVSAGGGAVGRRLLEVAIAARPAFVGRTPGWRVLAGLNASAQDLADLTALAARTAGDIVVERHRADFVARLQHCTLSISQAGYNTTMETLASGAPAVLVPFAGGHETEQTLRARLLAERGWIEAVEESSLSTATLVAAIERALARSATRTRPAIDLDGAAASARLLCGWLSERRG